MNLKKTIAIVAVMALAVGALAQGQGRGGFRMMGGAMGANPAMLLGREDVQDDLKLNSDQKGKLSDLRDKMMQRFRDMMRGGGGFGQQLSDEERKQRDESMKKINDEIKKDIEGILDADQQKRLKEISVQFQGNSVATNPEFQKDLNVTDAQKTKFADLQKKQGEAMRALGEKMRNQEIDFQGFREAMEKNNKIMNDEIGKLLTDDQKKKIAEMSGKPFVRKDENG